MGHNGALELILIEIMMVEICLIDINTQLRMLLSQPDVLELMNIYE